MANYPISAQGPFPQRDINLNRFSMEELDGSDSALYNRFGRSFFCTSILKINVTERLKEVVHSERAEIDILVFLFPKHTPFCE